MAHTSYILLSAVSILAWITIASTSPISTITTDEREERLINEIKQLRLIEDLKNELTNAIEHQDESDGVNDKIVEEVEQLRLLQEWQLSHNEDSPSDQVKILEEHVNIPTGATPSDNDDNTILENDSLQLQLFEAGTDEQGNRIYTVNSDTDHLEEDLQHLEAESGADASEDDEINDFVIQLENLSLNGSEDGITDLVKQLEGLSHLHDPEELSGTAAPSEIQSIDVLSDEEDSEETSAEESSEEASNEESAGEISSAEESSGENLPEESSNEVGSGEDPSNDADSHLIVSLTDDGSGMYDDKFALELEGLSLVTDGGNAVAVEEESSGTVMSGDGIFETEAPDAIFSYTSFITEIVTEIVEVEVDITTMTQTLEPEPTQKTTIAKEPESSTATVPTTTVTVQTTTKTVPTTTETLPTTTENALLTTEVVIYCPESHFECISNHHCIPQSMVCDTIPDCEDRSDENQDMCIPERQCNTGYFKCGNSPHCVTEEKRCDGIYHCFNGEDEANCFSCVDLHGHLKTLNPDDFCDGTRDCIDNMDEDRQRCTKPCIPGYHRCDDGLQCIKEDLVCNGIHNCRDKSDEKQCVQTMLDCWTYNMFACDGICLPQSALCDYVQDCMDKIDEKGCTFKPKTCPKTFLYQPETDSCIHTSLIYSEPYDLLQILDQTQDRDEEPLDWEKRKLMM